MKNCLGKLPEELCVDVKIDKAKTAKMSSTTAAPKIMEPAFVESLPYSCKTSTVIETEVAAKTIP